MKKQSFGEYLRKLRGDLSQPEFAEKIGMSPSTVSQYERGVRKKPEPETVEQISKSLNISLEKLWAVAYPEMAIIKLIPRKKVKKDIAKLKKDPDQLEKIKQAWTLLTDEEKDLVLNTIEVIIKRGVKGNVK